ncbi:MAG: lysylphosphatidylglycerol synthase transmembrane domain-containing protein [Candidatus Hatepunaea meridiana]|nr:lysylphosphatidylglycerol synthase transmembrane domain-containing protein [Candidatus Hatepunaea meridiana]
MKTKAFFFIKIAITLALLGLMFYTIRPHAILSALQSARYQYVAYALLLMPLNIYLLEYKWRYLARLVLPGIRFGETMGSLLGGMAFGIVTPGRIGEYGRGLFIKHDAQLNLVGLTVIDKFYNIGCNIAIGLPALMTLPWALNLFEGYFFVSTLVLIGIGDIALLYFALDPRPVRSLIYALQIMFPRKDRIGQLAHGLDRFSPQQARMVLLLTLAHYVVFLLQYFALICSFTSLNIITSSRGAAAVLFAKSALPIAIADLGVDQLVAVEFFGQFGATPEAAFNASILLFAINVLFPALVGVFFIGRLQIKYRVRK